MTKKLQPSNVPSKAIERQSLWGHNHHCTLLVGQLLLELIFNSLFFICRKILCTIVNAKPCPLFGIERWNADDKHIQQKQWHRCRACIMFLMGQLEEHLEPDAASVAMNLIQPLSDDGLKRERNESRIYSPHCLALWCICVLWHWASVVTKRLDSRPLPLSRVCVHRC